MNTETYRKKQEGGKTLKNALESYFRVMNKDKAEQISERVELNSFYNLYRGKDMKEEFLKEYERRAA